MEIFHRDGCIDRFGKRERNDIVDYFVLAINPGSTSTKIAIYKNDDELLKKVVNHPVEIIHKFGAIH
jgi:activator of 2-hydroxyglutaryl-CoA dehydratase